MIRRTQSFLVVATIAAISACSDGSPAEPDRASPIARAGTAANTLGDILGSQLPGQNGNGEAAQVSKGDVACSPQSGATAVVDVGPRGGLVFVGPHVLIVPPGALTSTVTITATIPDQSVAFVVFEPSGLVFKRPAGLLLSMAGCDTPSDYVPDVNYVNESGEVVERIEAVYSNYWHAIAAPIKHFSGYAVAW